MAHGHPSLLYFGDAEKKNFPLVLVFGREPNTNLPITNSKGPYNFDLDNSLFWNQIYWQVGSCAGISEQIIKAACRERNASPILFASPIPIGIESNESNKWAIREKITEDQCEEHLANVFAFKSLINRVAVIVMSGIERSEFEHSRKCIEAFASLRKIPTASISYVGDTYHGVAGGLITGDERTKVGEVVKAFALSNNSHVS